MCHCTNNQSDCVFSLGRDGDLINNLRLFMGGVRYWIRVGGAGGIYSLLSEAWGG